MITTKQQRKRKNRVGQPSLFQKRVRFVKDLVGNITGIKIGGDEAPLSGASTIYSGDGNIQGGQRVVNVGSSVLAFSSGIVGNPTPTSSMEIEMHNDQRIRLRGFVDQTGGGGFLLNSAILDIEQSRARIAGDKTENGITKKMEIMVNALAEEMTITDELQGQGLKYNTDYSNTFVTRSLVDKGYVDDRAKKTEASNNNPTPANGTSEGFEIGSIWVNSNTNEAWICTNMVSGQATWTKITS